MWRSNLSIRKRDPFERYPRASNHKRLHSKFTSKNMDLSLWIYALFRLAKLGGGVMKKTDLMLMKVFRKISSLQAQFEKSSAIFQDLESILEDLDDYEKLVKEKN